MYLKNERGMMLLDIVVALAVVAFSMTLGYKLLTFVVVESNAHVEDTKQLLQIKHYNNLFITDIREAKDFTLTTLDNVTTITYTTTDTKQITFTPTEPNHYTVSYNGKHTNDSTITEIVSLDSTPPIKYDPINKTVTFNHSIGNIPFNYTIHLRRVQNG